MFELVLARIRRLFRDGEYVVTLHAWDEMEDDGLSISDVEACVSSGRIVERQRDQVTGEWKYRIAGRGDAARDVEAVVKIGAAGKGVVITTYAL